MNLTTKFPHKILFVLFPLLSSLFRTACSQSTASPTEDVVQTILNTLEDSPSSQTTSPPQWTTNDEATLLDVFAEVTKDILTHKVIPETSVICDWNWSHLRCEPFCECALRPKWGDYHIGRSCRDDEIPMQEGEEMLCHLPPDTKYVRAIQSSAQKVQWVRNVVARVGRKAREGIKSGRLQVCDYEIPSGGGGGGLIGLSEDGVWIRTSTNSNPILSHLSSPASKLLEKPFEGVKKILKCDNDISDGIKLMDLKETEAKGDMEFRPITHFIPIDEEH